LGSAGAPAVSGYTLYLARNGVGLFILSLNPDGEAGSTKIGTANGRSIEAQAGGHAVRIDCSADVSPGGPAPVYGRFDASYRTQKDIELGPSPAESTK
jgi:hypothetical protein